MSVDIGGCPVLGVLEPDRDSGEGLSCSLVFDCSADFCLPFRLRFLSFPLNSGDDDNGALDFILQRFLDDSGKGLLQRNVFKLLCNLFWINKFVGVVHKRVTGLLFKIPDYLGNCFLTVIPADILRRSADAQPGRQKCENNAPFEVTFHIQLQLVL